MKKFIVRNVSEFLTDEEMKYVIGGYYISELGYIVGCEWDYSQCKCWVDVERLDGKIECRIETAFFNCVNACNTDLCVIFA